MVRTCVVSVSVSSVLPSLCRVLQTQTETLKAELAMSQHSRDQHYLASPRDTRHRRASSPGRFGTTSPHSSPGRYSGRSPDHSPTRRGSERRSPHRDLSPHRPRGREGGSFHDSSGRHSRSPHHSPHISPHHSPYHSSNSLQSPGGIPERRHSYSRVMDQQRERERVEVAPPKEKQDSLRDGRGECPSVVS